MNEYALKAKELRKPKAKHAFKRPTFKTTYEYDVNAKAGHPVLSKVLFQRSY
jgi:hypothetical protein